MFKYISNYINYKIITNSIIDQDIKQMFLELTKNKYTEWDYFIINSLYEFINKKYSDIDKTNLNISMLSIEFIMILFIKDEDFLKIVDLWWGKRNEDSEKYDYLINKLIFLYPQRFKIEN